MPPIDALNTRMAQLNAAGGDVISLGQSVPFFGPPPGMTDAVARALTDFGPRLHTYGPDAGIPELREALSRKLFRFNGVEADPATQIMVTPGSNQAFAATMMTLLEPGDEVAIASPYYFNHHMAIELCNGVVRPIPLSEENGFQMRAEDVERALTSRTKAVVIISPNNPTGAVYAPEEIAAITDLAARRGIYVISDDAYETFSYGRRAPRQRRIRRPAPRASHIARQPIQDARNDRMANRIHSRVPRLHPTGVESPRRHRHLRPPS